MPDRMAEELQCPRCGSRASSHEGKDLEGMCPGCVAALMVPGGRGDAAPLESGMLFRGLEVLEALGEGAMGIVYRARHVALDRPVALKVLWPRLAAQPDFARRFEREAKALALLDHPNIVRVSDFGKENDLYFLVLEHVDGTSLRTLMRESKLSATDALRIVPQICDALQYAHQLGVVHRDIKPENILIDRLGRVKVADFGLAKIDTVLAQNRTRTRDVMGTPHYMAPEQVEDTSAVDHRADIYSLGVVFYEILTGELPLGRFEPPSQRAGVAAGFDPVVLKSLERRPERRYQSAGEVRQHVTRIAPVSSLLRSARLWKATLASGIVLGVAAAAWALLGRGEQAAPPLAPPSQSWEELGGSARGGGVSATPGQSANPTLTLDGSGHPILAWHDNSAGNFEIGAKRWAGSAWKSLGGDVAKGGISGSPAASIFPALATDAGGTPFLAWEEGQKIYVRRWDGSAWTELGASASGGGVSATPGPCTRPSIALDRSGNAFVAWAEGSPPNQRICLKRWDGKQWIELGGSASASGLSGTSFSASGPVVAVDSPGRPVVAWHHRPSPATNVEIYLKAWDGSAWVELGGSAREGGISATPGRSWVPSLDLDAGGHPVVAWRDDTSGQFEILLRRWTGKSWEGLGGSDSGGGVSRTASHSNDPKLRLDKQGRPIVAWHETAGTDEVWLRRWDGTAWVGLAGSDIGGGISQTPHFSKNISFALDSGGRPVLSWQEEFPGNWEIHLRRLSAPPPAPSR